MISIIETKDDCDGCWKNKSKFQIIAQGPTDKDESYQLILCPTCLLELAGQINKVLHEHALMPVKNQSPSGK